MQSLLDILPSYRTTWCILHMKQNPGCRLSVCKRSFHSAVQRQFVDRMLTVKLKMSRSGSDSLKGSTAAKSYTPPCTHTHARTESLRCFSEWEPWLLEVRSTERKSIISDALRVRRLLFNQQAENPEWQWDTKRDRRLEDSVCSSTTCLSRCAHYVFWCIWGLGGLMGEIMCRRSSLVKYTEPITSHV